MRRLASCCGFLLLLLVMIVAGVDAVSAATLRGTVYNLYLEELDRAIVTIDTTPTQVIVSQQGGYAFTVPKGEYTLIAYYEENGTIYKTEELVAITKEGDYVIDLILVPSVEEKDVLDNVTHRELAPFEARSTPLDIIVLALLMFLVLYLILTRTHFLAEEEAPHEHASPPPSGSAPGGLVREAEKVQEEVVKSEAEEDAEKFLAFLREQGGRATQKEIRKKFPMSEAKVSLLLADLEAKHLVSKIKKGRGNIIILNA